MFFKKYKMEIEKLKQENEALKAQIVGLAFNLKTTEDKLNVANLRIQNLSERNLELSSEVRHLSTVVAVNNNNRNDSRYY